MLGRETEMTTATMGSDFRRWKRIYTHLYNTVLHVIIDTVLFYWSLLIFVTHLPTLVSQEYLRLDWTQAKDTL